MGFSGIHSAVTEPSLARVCVCWRRANMDLDTSAAYVGDLGWIGCPHCERPVNAQPVRDRALRVFVIRLLALLERGKVAPATLIEKLGILSADLYEDETRETSHWYPVWMLGRLDPEECTEDARTDGGA